MPQANRKHREQGLRGSPHPDPEAGRLLVGTGTGAPPAQPPTLASTLPDLEISLLELADRLLNKGVVLTGEATISVAGIDLIYLGLNLVLSSVETMREAGRHASGGGSASPGEHDAR